MKFRYLPLALLLFAAPAFAQTPAGPASRLAWNQPLSTDQTLSGYTHFASVDGAAPVALTRTCSGTPTPQGFACTAPLPAMTPGTHVVRVIARYTVQGQTFEAAEGAPGDRISLTLIVVLTPTGVTVAPQP
jgi:hypothetical protein